MTKICFNALIFKSNSSPRQPKLMMSFARMGCRFGCSRSRLKRPMHKTKSCPLFSTPNRFSHDVFPLDRGRPSGGKVRHKRQALQDMARPLKQWLYKHRDNPYPTKTEKILLALGSQMTLVQVSPICGSNQIKGRKVWKSAAQRRHALKEKAKFPHAVVSLGLKSSILMCVLIKRLTKMF